MNIESRITKYEKERKEVKMKKALKSRLTACVFVLVAVGLGTVIGGDVIVKEGTIGVKYVCPTPTDETQKVLAFVSDGAPDVKYGYGLLTVTSDATYGTKNYYGTMCEYFPDATTLGLYRTGAKFYTCPVGLEANIRLYYGLDSQISPMDGYSTNSKTVYMIAIGASVTNPNNVASPIYTTKGLYACAQPVAHGKIMTGAMNLANYGVEVLAKLDGDYQATSGSGQNFGIKITTTDALDAAADQLINSYALYLKPFTSNANLHGGVTYGIYQEGSGVMNYFEGDVTVAGIFDNTPGYTGTAQDALAEVLNTRSVDGEIDHSSLPVLGRATVNRVEKTNQRIVEYTDPTGKVREREEYDIEIVEEEGRSLGGMITVLTEAVKGLNEKVETLQAENQTLKAEIAALKAQ